MVRKINYGKIVAVVFLTVLIWVWADLAKTEEFRVLHAVITVAKSTNPNLLVSFGDESSASTKESIEEIVLEGPASRIAKVEKKQKEGELLRFDFDAVQEKMDEPGSYSLTLLSFLQRDKEIKQLGLKVTSCKPETISVRVVRLIRKPLKIVCLDEDGRSVGATFDPTSVDIFVPEDWDGVAEVRLSRGEREQAREVGISRPPSVTLPGGQVIKAETPVKIRVSQAEVLLGDEIIKVARPGFVLSENLVGTYRIIVDILTLMNPIKVRATPDAKRAYEKEVFHVILEIHDSDKDAKTTELLRRKLIYNFPEEYLRKGEIELNQEPVEAKFKLERLPTASEPAGGGG